MSLCFIVCHMLTSPLCPAACCISIQDVVRCANGFGDSKQSLQRPLHRLIRALHTGQISAPNVAGGMIRTMSTAIRRVLSIQSQYHDFNELWSPSSSDVTTAAIWATMLLKGLAGFSDDEILASPLDRGISIAEYHLWLKRLCILMDLITERCLDGGYACMRFEDAQTKNAVQRYIWHITHELTSIFDRIDPLPHTCAAPVVVTLRFFERTFEAFSCCLGFAPVDGALHSNVLVSTKEKKTESAVSAISVRAPAMSASTSPAPRTIAAPTVSAPATSVRSTHAPTPILLPQRITAKLEHPAAFGSTRPTYGSGNGSGLFSHDSSRQSLHSDREIIDLLDSDSDSDSEDVGGMDVSNSSKASSSTHSPAARIAAIPAATAAAVAAPKVAASGIPHNDPVKDTRESQMYALIQMFENIDPGTVMSTFQNTGYNANRTVEILLSQSGHQ
jgi:hypothetical protein